MIGDSTCNSRFHGVVDGASVLRAESPDTVIRPGDSGSALIRNATRGPQLVGVTGFAGEVLGKGCGAGYANGFADAVRPRRWLTSSAHVLASMTHGQLMVTGDACAESFMTCVLPRWDIKPTEVTYSWQQKENPIDGSVGRRVQAAPVQPCR